MYPLEHAILKEDLDTVKQLLTERPEDIDLQSEDNLPMAFLAAQTGNLALIQYIVEYSRASMNLRDGHNRTILHHAVLSGKIDAIPYLVERVGMSPTDGDCNLITPFQLAHDYSFMDIEEYFSSIYNCQYNEMYHNPIRTGMFPDPSIVRVGDDYYMANSSFIFFPSIPISHSKDLVHWEIIGHAITNPKWANIDELEGGRGFWAPDISYFDGKFYVTATYRMNDTGSVIRRQIVVSSTNPEGPYSEPAFIDEDGIDPSIFRDDDGKCYMLLNRGARILELSTDATKQISEASLLFYGDQKRAPEGPHLLKKDGWYYLFEAEGGTGAGHRITVSRSKTLKGIYQPCPYNPIMRQWDEQETIQRCGHGKPVQTQHGDWYMVYLCGRMIDGKYSMLGRETALDPITWTPDGWPIVNNLQGPSALQKLPLPEETKACAMPYTFSNGETNYSFDKVLSFDFMTPRTPTEDGLLLKDNMLHIKASRHPLSSMHSKNIVVRRQTDFSFIAYATMQIPSLENGQNAGMTCYYDENTYLKFGIEKRNNSLAIILYEYVLDTGVITAQAEIPEDQIGQNIVFTVQTDYLKRTFSYQINDKTYLLTALDNVYYLCDEGIKKGKRFTGAMVGMYVENTNEGKDFYASFSHFSYKALPPMPY